VIVAGQQPVGDSGGKMFPAGSHSPGVDELLREVFYNGPSCDVMRSYESWLLD
jgi:hypothetical protein